MVALRLIYYLFSVVPAALYLAVLVIGDRYGGRGADYGGFMLIVPIYLSFALGTLGVPLVLASRRRGQSLIGPAAATLLAGGIFLWFLGKAIMVFAARPLLIYLGL